MSTLKSLVSTTLISLAVLLGGCGPGGLICKIVPGEASYDRCNDYSVGWTNVGSEAPRCADELLTALEDLNPAPALNPLHGVIVWHPAPFYCGPQMVWGCSELGKDFVDVDVAAAAGVHASDTALAEEVAHWVWSKYRPTVLTEEWRKDPLTGTVYYWRDPDFMAYYRGAAEAARACP